MKRGILLLSILVLAFVPAVASAQGFLGGAIPSLPGLPSLGGFFGSGGGCGACEEPSPISLSGTVAWNYEAIDLNCSTLDYQYAGFGAFKHTLQIQRPPTRADRCRGFTYRIRGVGAISTSWLPVAPKIPKTTMKASGQGIFKAHATGPPRMIPIPSRAWDSTTFSTLPVCWAGFRWDHLETTFDRPTWTSRRHQQPRRG